jgi:hypothetical protein
VDRLLFDTVERERVGLEHNCFFTHETRFSFIVIVPHFVVCYVNLKVKWHHEIKLNEGNTNFYFKFFMISAEEYKREMNIVLFQLEENE